MLMNKFSYFLNCPVHFLPCHFCWSLKFVADGPPFLSGFLCRAWWFVHSFILSWYCQENRFPSSHMTFGFHSRVAPTVCVAGEFAVASIASHEIMFYTVPTWLHANSHWTKSNRRRPKGKRWKVAIAFQQEGNPVAKTARLRRKPKPISVVDRGIPTGLHCLLFSKKETKHFMIRVLD